MEARTTSRQGVGRGSGRRRARGFALVLVLLAAFAPARGRAQEQTLFPIQRALAPVRANLALLGRGAVVFIGRFHRRIDDDWAAALCRDPALLDLGDRFVFVRHARRRALDGDELWLRARGVPRAWAFEGVLVVDARGETAAVLERPVEPARLREALARAAARADMRDGAERRFRHEATPRYSFRVPEGLRVLSVGEGGVDLRLFDETLGAELTVRAQRVGPAGARGAEHQKLVRAALRVAGKALATWAYEEAGAGPDARSWRVLEAMFARGGDVYTVRARSRRCEGAALRRRLEALLAALLDGET